MRSVSRQVGFGCASALTMAFALGVPAIAAAQTPPYVAPEPLDATSAPAGSPTPAMVGSPPSPQDGDGVDAGGGGAADPLSANGGGAAPPKRVSIKPYIEAGQAVDAYFSPTSDVLTYSEVAVGADAQINTRSTQGTVSVRYQRNFGWGSAADSNAVTGVAQMSTQIVPGTLKLDYGALADRIHVEGSGATANTPATTDAISQIYSVYAGPSLHTSAGDVGIDGHYHAGYTSVGTPSGATISASPVTADVFSHSVVQDAELSAGTRAGQGLPVGLSAEGGYYQEDVSNLAQRVRDAHVRGQVTIPVSSDVALMGGVGYEDVQVSSKDALRDANGNPVVDASGRYVTNEASPRIIAYDTSGLIWDAGVSWRPSSRTHAELHVGRRYGSTGAYGFFVYAPNSRQSFDVVVYNNVAGFGGELTDALEGLPTQFQTVRNGITGNIAGCVASQQQGSCIAGALGSVNSAVFHGRGVAASYALDLGRVQTGIGVGYDRRSYYGAPGTVLANIAGEVDQDYWAAAYLNGRIDRRSSFSTTLTAYRFQSGLSSDGDLTGIQASAMLQRELSPHLSASASLAIDGLLRDSVADIWAASAAMSVRYTF